MRSPKASQLVPPWTKVEPGTVGYSQVKPVKGEGKWRENEEMERE